MILVDTSIWVDHLRGAHERLADLLTRGLVLAHPFVTGELALGNLAQRETVLLALQDLPQAMLAADAEVLSFVEKKGLFGRGIGYVDAHLLAAVFLTPGSRLWTRDNSLFAASTHLGVAANLWH